MREAKRRATLTLVTLGVLAAGPSSALDVQLPVAVDGLLSADVQGVAETDLAQSLRFGGLIVPEGVTVASASGVFLEEPCSPGSGVPGLGGPALAALAALLAAAALLLGVRRSLRAAT